MPGARDDSKVYDVSCELAGRVTEVGGEPNRTGPVAHQKRQARYRGGVAVQHVFELTTFHPPPAAPRRERSVEDGDCVSHVLLGVGVQRGDVQPGGPTWFRSALCGCFQGEYALRDCEPDVAD